MAYEVKDKLSVKVLFNDEEFLFGRANSLEFLHMVCSTRVAVPMMHLALQDNIDFLSESKHMADGARIQIVLAPRGNPSVTYVFRLNSYKRSPSAGGYRYEIDGYVDASTYWHTSTSQPEKGTSYSTLSKIASSCGLSFQGSQTADNQVWLPRNQRYHQWAREIAMHGYRSDTSCMQLGLNFDKTLVYKDITEATTRTRIFKFGEYQKGTLVATDIVPTVAPGSSNHFSGYSGQLIEQDPSLSTLFKVNSKVSVSKDSNEKALLMNSKIKGAASQSRVVFAPIDCGNNHDNFERAAYQNARINNLFSSRIDLVTPELTGIKLLDVVSVVLDKGSSYLQAFSGDFRVSTRTIRVQGNEYFEKLELLRKSANVGLKDAL